MKFRSSRVIMVTAALAAAAMALTACTTGASGAGATSTAKEVKSFALIGGVRDSPFYSAIDCGAKTEAGKLKVQYSYDAPETFSPSAQQPILSSVVAKGPNAIAIAPTDSTAMFQPIHQAKQSGITMMSVDTALNDTSDLSAQITSDNIAGGALGADEMAKLIGESGKVVAVSEPPGSSTDDLRVKGFVDRIKSAYPNIQLLTTQYADHSAAATASKVASIIAANPDLKGVFAVDNFTGDGAPIGVANANAQKTVKIIAFDAQPSQVQALKAGQIAGIVSQNPYQMGVDSVQQAVQLGQGKTVAKKTITPLKFITKDNVDDPSSQPFIYKSC